MKETFEKMQAKDTRELALACSGAHCAKADTGAREGFDRACIRLWCNGRARVEELRRSEAGQGTTEYAILVGVLVVIAILAIVAFRPKLQELWNAIAEGIGSL